MISPLSPMHLSLRAKAPTWRSELIESWSSVAISEYGAPRRISGLGGGPGVPCAPGYYRRPRASGLRPETESNRRRQPFQGCALPPRGDRLVVGCDHG